MKLISKMSKKIAVLLLAMMMATPQFVMAQETNNTVEAKQEIRLQDDFYEAINKEW